MCIGDTIDVHVQLLTDTVYGSQNRYKINKPSVVITAFAFGTTIYMLLTHLIIIFCRKIFSTVPLHKKYILISTDTAS